MFLVWRPPVLVDDPMRERHTERRAQVEAVWQVLEGAQGLFMRGSSVLCANKAPTYWIPELKVPFD